MQRGRDLVLDLRAPLHQAPAARNQPAHRPGALVAHPHGGDQIGGQQVGQDPRVDLVGLDLRVADRPHLLGVREHDLSHVPLKDPRDGQRVARRLHHHAIIRGEALREQPELLGRRPHPADRPVCRPRFTGHVCGERGDHVTAA